MSTSAKSVTSDRLRRAAHRLLFGWLGAGRPVPVAALDQEYASGHWDHFAAATEAPRYAALARLILAAPVQPPRILDVGCGSGELARHVCSGTTVYLGVDLSHEGLRRAAARALPGATFVHGDFERWRSDSTWDVIVFNEVIGYARWPDRVLADFSTALSPAGRIVVSYYRAGNHAAIWRRIERRFVVQHREEVTSPSGTVWDLKVLSPRPSS